MTVLLRGLNPAPQYFSHTPGLRNATTRKMWIARIEHFANGTNSVVLEMLRKASKKFSGIGVVFGMHFQPGINKRPN